MSHLWEKVWGVCEDVCNLIMDVLARCAEDRRFPTRLPQISSEDSGFLTKFSLNMGGAEGPTRRPLRTQSFFSPTRLHLRTGVSRESGGKALDVSSFSPPSPPVSSSFSMMGSICAVTHTRRRSVRRTYACVCVCVCGRRNGEEEKKNKHYRKSNPSGQLACCLSIQS